MEEYSKSKDIGVTYIVIGIIENVPNKFTTIGIIEPIKNSMDCFEKIQNF